MVLFEHEVTEYLGLPGIPRKEWNGRDAFAKGVALLDLTDGREAYAVATYDTEKDEAPRVVKVFGIEPFRGVKQILVVPNYMTSMEEVEGMDLDAESKKKVKEILREAEEMENEGVKEKDAMEGLPEWVFDEIHSREEAEAWLRNYNQANRIRGRIPTTDETLKLRLYAIYTNKGGGGKTRKNKGK